MVEDHAINSKVVETALRSVGVTVVSTETALDALEQLEDGSFDMILMDIQLPGMSGDEAIKQIRKSGTDYAEIPIIALTAQCMEGDRERFLSAGADGYVPKPVLIPALFKEIARCARTVKRLSSVA